MNEESVCHKNRPNTLEVSKIDLSDSAINKAKISMEIKETEKEEDAISREKQHEENQENGRTTDDNSQLTGEIQTGGAKKRESRIKINIEISYTPSAEDWIQKEAGIHTPPDSFQFHFPKILSNCVPV